MGKRNFGKTEKSPWMPFQWFNLFIYRVSAKVSKYKVSKQLTGDIIVLNSLPLVSACFIKTSEIFFC